jgi:NAD-dependent DNA ligase
VATRGDGKSGQDVSYLADYLRDIPRTCGIRGEQVEIRGDLYLPRDGGFDTGGKPLRNACVGLVNRKDRRDDLRHVRFIAYQILGAGGFQRESEKISFLQTEGFHTVDFIVTDNTAQIDKYFEQYLNTLRGTWPYETDGLIVTVDECPLHDEIDARKVVDHHHHYSIALKPPAEARRTRLAGIEWQVKPQGSVILLALFERLLSVVRHFPARLLHNHETVQTLHLQPGGRTVN